MNDRYLIFQFTFEDGIEILRSTDADQTVSIGQTSKHTNIIAAFELCTHRHDDLNEMFIKKITR